MPAVIDRSRSTLVLIDLQPRLMPVIHDGEILLENATRLRKGAALLGVPVVVTEQNPERLGATTAELGVEDAPTAHKLTFDACETAECLSLIPEQGDLVLAGVEAHVCVLQTALGLVRRKRRVIVVADAVGSRKPDNRDAALRRMERHGVELVTAEMVLFEWLGTAGHPRFREVLALIR